MERCPISTGTTSIHYSNHYKIAMGLTMPCNSDLCIFVHKGPSTGDDKHDFILHLCKQNPHRFYESLMEGLAASGGTDIKTFDEAFI
jgi:hypothetical protein